MATTHEARSISISISRDWREVYDFAHPSAHFADWASGLATSLRPAGNDNHWIAETPEGTAIVRFAERNAFGVLDHTVTQADGVQTYNPLRVVVNSDGAEVIFTLFRRPDMSDDVFERDQACLARDLQTLKQLIES